ncbi:MAG: COX15/CtaA family protein [Ignavibacteriales bacterium]|nr:COX15/CtaA family protein [Ignavibacteriales bacterium]
MNDIKSYNKPLHYFAFFTACCTFCLIIAGGLVTSTGSGLAVPDWPLSYGQVMPPMVGGIFYEHGHRMIATVVGFLTTILAIWLWRKEERKWMRVLGIVALCAVIAQGLLGGLTVIFLLPTAVSVSHATLAQTFFSIVASIALFTSKWWRSEQPLLLEEGNKASIVKLTVLTTLAVYVQLILGALMRHTHSGLVVPDFPLAYGQLFPSLSPESLQSYNSQLIYSDIRLAADGDITSGQIFIHMLHRGWAFVVLTMVLWTSFRLRKSSQTSKRLSRFSLLLISLVVVQVTLGALTVLSRKEVDVTTAHVATGALLLVVCVVMTLHVIKLTDVKVRSVFPIFARKAIV